jgi:fructose-1-phosphate kinase PfkB-like protein
LASGIPAVAISGSLPPGAPPDTVARLVGTARGESANLIAVDTAGEPLRLAARAGPHLIKVNLDEFASSYDLSGDTFAAVEIQYEQLAQRGVDILCLTAGPRGALVLTPNDCFAVRTEVRKPLSTAGAGDAFLAGLLFGLMCGHTLIEAARLASATAAAALRQVGAGFIEPADVEAVLPRTQLLDAEAFFAEPRP